MVRCTGSFSILLREAMIPRSWYCSVLTKSINCTLQSSSCRFSNNRALLISIVRIIPINGQSPKAVVPTISIHVHRPKSVQAIPINRQPVKTVFKTISTNRHSPRSFVWTFLIIWKHQSIVQTIEINRPPPGPIVHTSSIDWKCPKSIVQTISIYRQSP